MQFSQIELLTMFAAKKVENNDLLQNFIKSFNGDDIWCKAREMSRDNFSDWCILRIRNIRQGL
jgi:hypothetical protein